MRNITEETITSTVLQSIANTENPRLKTVLTSLIQHLHDFVREVDLTQDEWITAIDFLTQAGAKTSPERNEFILTSDILGVSSLVDLISNRGAAGTTSSSLLGPFYIEGAKMLEVGGDLIGDNAGEPVVVAGRVLTPEGQPIPDALLEVWQNAANGLYDSQDAEQPFGNLRCGMRTDSAGHYQFTTIKPIPYTVPEDGPIGEILHAVGRHPWRPAHLHFKISADGYKPLITELFFSDDPYLDEDAVFGVRNALVLEVDRLETIEEAAPYNVKPGSGLVAFDFGLQPLV